MRTFLQVPLMKFCCYEGQSENSANVISNMEVFFFCIIEENLWIIIGFNFTNEVLFLVLYGELEVCHLRKLWIFTNVSNGASYSSYPKNISVKDIHQNVQVVYNNGVPLHAIVTRWAKI